MKQKQSLHIGFFTLLLWISFCAQAQKPKGIPYIRNYQAKEYKQSTDNWSIVQDQRGIIFVGNAGGIIEYDGVNWKGLVVTNNSIVRSMALDPSGIIYVGAVGEIGFLQPNLKGKMVYHSLTDQLPEKERDFADVWKTYVTKEGVYFQCFTKLIRISKTGIKIWKPESSFHFSFFVNNTLYITERGLGLKRMSEDKLILIPDGHLFADLRTYSILPVSEHTLLVATREKGLVFINNEPMESNVPVQFWDVEASRQLIKDQTYGGVALPNGRYAFATLQNGIMIVNHKGDVEQVLNTQNGLHDNIVNYIAVDNEQNLWAALGNGLSHIEISSPLNFINTGQGLDGSIQDVIKFKGDTYVATSLGIFKAVGDHFVAVKGMTYQTWSFTKIKTEKDSFLLASSEAGVFKIEDLNATLLYDGFGYIICQSGLNPDKIYFGMGDGLACFRLQNGQLIHEAYIKGIDKEIRSITEDKKGNLWLGTPFDGVIHVRFTGDKYSVDSYDTKDGLPDLKYSIPYQFNGKIVFATARNIFEFDEAKKRFYESSMLGNHFNGSQIYRFIKSNDSTVWMFTVGKDGQKETGIVYLRNNQLSSWYSKPFRKIKESEIHAIYPDENNITWLGGPDGLLRYDGNVKKNFDQKFNAHVRSVIIGKDSLIFEGNFYNTADSTRHPVMQQPEFAIPSIPYKMNAIRFEYAAASYDNEQSNEYNIFLEGFDEEWSDWSTKNQKEYTNLKEGKYVFHLKAKNIYGTESLETTYSFVIETPWYRTIIAYIIYAISIIAFVYILIQFSIRRLKRAKTLLEKTVKERTAEVVKQKEEVEIQKQIVEHKNKDITDSINYAQRIQRALLASDTLLKNNLPDYFIFFQPKDIVSGDFYWASKLSNGTFVLVTADSTGHGVPGAIMSMLNISCLNEAINGQKLIAPNEILNYTRSKIIEHLANDGSAEGGKDGMDCSLICFDTSNQQITFAAANNPVWIVRNNEIIEFNPDKMPVGKHDNDSVSFTLHTITIQKNDVVYALTDGFPDQFGGPKGKKFMYKQLKELLISISHLPMNEQHNILHTTINQWKGELEQVDDICLIGVRI